MKTVPFASVSRKLIAEVAQMTPGENVLILTDTEVSERISASLAVAVQAGGGVPSIIIMVPSEYPGAPLPGPVEQAVKGAEVVLMATSRPVAHAAVFAREMKFRRLVSLPGIMEESFVEGGGTMDLKELRAITERVARALEGRRHFHLTSDKGADATFLSRGRPFAAYAQLSKPAGFTMFPDGECGICLEEKTLEGRIVMDIYQTGVGPLREPISFEIRKGKVVKIEGGMEARLLRELLENHGDENSYYFGEFALGTNPKARFIGSAGEDKKCIGTVHMSLGDDVGIGGDNKSKLHLDGVIGRPTLVADNQMLIKDGVLLIQ